MRVLYSWTQRICTPKIADEGLRPSCPVTPNISCPVLWKQAWALTEVWFTCALAMTSLSPSLEMGFEL